jgi:hypothetical protein
MYGRFHVTALLLPAALASCVGVSPPPSPEPSATPSASASAPSAVASSPPAAASSAAPVATPPASAEAPGTYALVVSFFSPGNGTDRAAFDKLTAIVAKLPKEVAQVTGHWGKEGEHDECFALTELDAKEKAAFVAQVKKEVGASDRVTIKENAACQSR